MVWKVETLSHGFLSDGDWGTKRLGARKCVKGAPAEEQEVQRGELVSVVAGATEKLTLSASSRWKPFGRQHERRQRNGANVAPKNRVQGTAEASCVGADAQAL